MGKSSSSRWVRGLVLAVFASVLPAVGAAQSVFPPSTGPNTACATNSLASYQSLGFGGCTVGSATYYNFTSSSDTNGNYSPSFINVTPDASGQPSVGFDSSLFSISSGFQHYTIEYYVDPPIDILGLRFNDAPFQNAFATIDICIDNTFAANCPPSQILIESVHTNAVGPNQDEYFAEIDPNNPSAAVQFAHTTQFMDVILDIYLDASTGPASIPSLSQTTLLTPEPGALALSGIGGVALLAATFGARRRARKNRG